MRENDGRRLDHATLETIRLQAVRAVADGERPAAVAKRLGMSRAAVYAWLDQVRAGGPEALAAKPIRGDRPSSRSRRSAGSTSCSWWRAIRRRWESAPRSGPASSSAS